MIGEGWLRISGIVQRHLAADPTAASLCRAGTEALMVTGVGLSLVTGTQPGPSYGSDESIAILEELQYLLGEGPSGEASRLRRPILQTALDATDRWPSFAAAAVESKVLAVFGFPLIVGAAHLGALTFYQDTGGALSRQQYIDALITSELVTQAILDMQGGAPPGSLARGLAQAGSHQAAVHQASGMVSVQLSISIEEALVRLRAHAFSTGQTLDGVALDVLARRLLLQGDG